MVHLSNMHTNVMLVQLSCSAVGNTAYFHCKGGTSCHFEPHLPPQGPRHPPPSPSPNRFSPVAPLFFFPLMASYDAALPTLDLLGRDTLLLGNLLHTLSTVLFAATHCPAEPPMAAALLEFSWALRYHPSRCVEPSS